MSTESSDHNTIEQLAAFLDGALTPVEREAVQRHLDECDRCRAEISAAAGALAELPARTRRRWVGMAAAAAAATLLLVPLTSSRDERGGAPIERSGESVAIPTFAITTPAEGSSLSDGAVVFSWEAPEGASSYELMVTTEVGDVVWSERTRETTSTLPDSIVLDPGIHFWVVDALLERGREATTGVHSFTVAR